jgi:hypothetical protein
MENLVLTGNLVDQSLGQTDIKLMELEDDRQNPKVSQNGGALKKAKVRIYRS